VITAMPRIAIAMRDYAAAVALFRDGFGLPVLDFSDRTVGSLGVHVGMCMPPGGSNIELMCPANPALPLSQALQRFLDRRDEGPYALMLEAPDPDAEAVGLAERGLDVMALMAGAGGRDVHPRSTHGVLIRVYPDGSVADPGGLRAAEPGLSGIARVIVATTDAALAADAYGRGFGLTAGRPFHDDGRGVLAVHCHAPEGGVIELVSPVDPDRPFSARIQDALKERGEGMWALVLQADDAARAAEVLRARGLPVEGDAATPELTVVGTRFLIESR
jgi:catechol 2,3-dioxygenase-like lactoylglutathione lyase family enzyme